ncbi:hypothetical protein RISK_002539 [Rhodopirellula islandica]|uniref:Uncharacterized protein n=2 Tax=Rhodopirellula islandica TaxID=595434 RepID=A0A0J1BFH7_RHOIS|nr:hypothetical protein RISK_002539 [Rhodopirellula islandica]
MKKDSKPEEKLHSLSERQHQTFRSPGERPNGSQGETQSFLRSGFGVGRAVEVAGMILVGGLGKVRPPASIVAERWMHQTLQGLNPLVRPTHLSISTVDRP